MRVKLRRDLRASWSRFALMVIAIAVSLTVFGAFVLAWSAIGRETSGAYLATEPASATIVLDQPIEADRMAAIVAAARQRPGVIEATGRTQFNTDVEVNGQPRNFGMQVFVAAPDDPMRIVKFAIDGESTWPPPPGEILIRDDSLTLLGVAVGDTVSISPPGGERVELRVAGTVYDPSLAPTFQEQRGRAYLSAAAVVPAGAPARLDQLKLQAADPGQVVPTRDRDRAVSVATDVAAWLQREYGLAVAEIQVPEPYAHPHQWQADVLLLSLVAGGAAALLLSAILVANMLNTLFTRQIPQIGIMKAIGGGTGDIVRLYLAMIVVVAAAATLLAMGPAILIGQALLAGLLAMLGVEPVSLAAPWQTYAVIVAVGLGLPPLITLVPLLRTARTTVRAAIDHHGGSVTPGAATGILARVSRSGRLDRSLLLALRNTVRRPARFGLSTGLLAIAGMVFVAGMSLNAGLQALDEERRAQTYWDVEVALAGPADEAAVTSALAEVPGVSRGEAFARVQVGLAGRGQVPVTRTYPDQGHGSLALQTAPADRELPSAPLLEGRWLNAGETSAVVISQRARESSIPTLMAGDSVDLFIGGAPSTWRIVGIVEEAEGSGSGVYATPEGLADATAGAAWVNQLRIVTERHDETSRQAVADAVDAALGGAGIRVASAASVSRSLDAATGHAGPLVLVLLGIAIPLGVIGGIGLASIMSANVLDRIREFGVLHAIGARPERVRRIVIAEGIILAMSSILVAVLPTLGLTALLGAGLGDLFTGAPLPYRISPLAVGIWIAVVVLGAILATEAAATRAARLTVREALAYL